jgi:transaldolase
MIMTVYKSLLHQMAMTTPTDFWNDSCSIPELTYALQNGAVGATTNPVIVHNVLKKELPQWKDRVQQIIEADPCASEVEITWRVVEALAIHAAKMLMPVYEREHGLKGRISIQTNPQFYRNPAAIVEQGEHFQALYPNLQIKIPVTQAGIMAAEELTYRGVHITATVCFTVAQALAVGEAVERGLARRAAEGKSVDEMNPVCAIMIGRTDDWMQVAAKRDGIAIDPGYLHWAGIAVFKRSYQIFQERGYRTRLLAAAMRHIMHWTELIGADAAITMPYEWQLFYNQSNVEVLERIEVPVSKHMIGAMYTRIPDFRRAYDPDGLHVTEFDAYGATARTLRSFMASYFDLMTLIRDFMMANPDKKGP